MTWPLVVGLGSHHGDDQAGWLNGHWSSVTRVREVDSPEPPVSFNGRPKI
jgi:hypothetical protein